MQYDLSQFPVSDDGEQLKNEKGVSVTYRETLMKAIANDMSPDGGTPLPSSTKFPRYDLYTKIRKNGGDIIDLTVDEVSMLNAAALAFPAIVAGQVRDYLNNPNTGKALLPADVAAEQAALAQGMANLQV